MTQPLMLGLLFIGLGLLASLFPYRFNIFRLKRFARVLVPERFHALVPKVVGSLLTVVGLVFLVLSLTVLRPDPRGLPVHFVNAYGKQLEWVALEYPRDVEVVRGGPVAPGKTCTLYYRPPSFGRLVAAFKRPDFDKSQGGAIPIDVGPRSVGKITLTIAPDATITVENGVFGQ
jgi:hypothetical protein